MGTMFHPNFIEAYFRAGHTYQLPLMLLRLTEERAERWKDQPDILAALQRRLENVEEEGFPIIDHLYQMPLREPDDRLGDVIETIAALEPGLTHFIVHPTKNTAEVRAITPEDWQGRVADYQCFIHDDLRDYLIKSGIQVITYRTLREAMRGNS